MIIRSPMSTGFARQLDRHQLLIEAIAREDACGLKTPLTDFRPCENILDRTAILLDREDSNSTMITCGKCLPDCFTMVEGTTVIRFTSNATH